MSLALASLPSLGRLASLLDLQQQIASQAESPLPSLPWRLGSMLLILMSRHPPMDHLVSWLEPLALASSSVDLGSHHQRVVVTIAWQLLNCRRPKWLSHRPGISRYPSGLYSML